MYIEPTLLLSAIVSSLCHYFKPDEIELLLKGFKVLLHWITGNKFQATCSTYRLWLSHCMSSNSSSILDKSALWTRCSVKRSNEWTYVLTMAAEFGPRKSCRL